MLLHIWELSSLCANSLYISCSFPSWELLWSIIGVASQVNSSPTYYQSTDKHKVDADKTWARNVESVCFQIQMWVFEWVHVGGFAGEEAL